MQSLVEMKEAELLFWQVVVAVIVELSALLGFWEDDSVLLSVALRFCSVFMLWISCQCFIAVIFE